MIKRITSLFLALLLTLQMMPLSVLAGEITEESGQEIVTDVTDGAVQESAAETTEDPTTAPTEIPTGVPVTEPAVESTGESAEEPTEETAEEPTEEISEPSVIPREAWLTELVELFGLALDADAEIRYSFHDYDSSAENYTAVITAAEHGMVDVAPGEALEPQAPVTRQFAAFSVNALLDIGVEEGTVWSFSDAQDAAHPEDAEVAVRRGWFALVEGAFCPERNITEEEKAVILADAEELLRNSALPENPVTEEVCAHGGPAAGCCLCPVEAMIDALPTIEAIQAMDEAAYVAASVQLQSAMDAYSALTEEEQAKLRNGEVLLSLVGAFSLHTLSLSLEDEDIITRAEWLRALVATFNMTVEDDNYPDNYFVDLPSESEYYYDVLLAVEFGLIDVPAGGEVRPADPATREFAAQTLNFCLGFQLEGEEYVFSDADVCTYPTDDQIALNRKWFEMVDGAFCPERNITTAEKDAMLADAKAILEETTLPDGFISEYTFQPDVVVFPYGTDVEIDENGVVTIYEADQMVVPGEAFVVYPTPLAVLYTAVTVSGDETMMTITTTEADDSLLTSVNVKGSVPVDMSQFVAGEGIDAQYIRTETQAAAASQTFGTTIPMGSVVLSGQHNVEGNQKISYSVSITNIAAHVALDSKAQDYYLTVSADASVDVSASVDFNKAIKIPKIKLGKIRIFGVGVVEWTLEMSFGGKVSLSYGITFEDGFHYSNGDFRLVNNFRKTGFSLSIAAQVSVGLRASVGADVIAAEAKLFVEGGIAGEAELKAYTDGQAPYKCVDLAAYLYAKLGLNAKVLKKEAEFALEFCRKDNSPARVYYHIEDGQKVQKCARGGEIGGDGGTSGGGYLTPDDSPFGDVIVEDGSYDTSIGDGSGDGSGDVTSSSTLPMWEYTVNEDGTATITDYYGSASSISIPSTIDGYTVTTIGDGLGRIDTEKLEIVTYEDPFGNIEKKWGYVKRESSLSVVTIPDTVTNIAGEAFEDCGKLSLVSIPSSVMTIGYGAFRNCTNLRNLQIPESVTTIGYEALANTAIRRFHVTSNMKSVSLSGSRVSEVTFEKGITALPTGLTYEAEYLTEVTIPATVTETNGALGGDYVESLIFEDGMTSIPDGAASSCKKLVTVVIPDSVTHIGSEAFYGCSSLSSLTLPPNLVSMGIEILGYTDGVKELTIPKTVTTMRTLEEGVEDAEYEHTWDLALLRSSIETLIFEEGTTMIPHQAAAGVDTLKKVVIPKSVTTIGYEAFYGTSLTSIELHEGLKKLCYGFLYGVEGITELTLPASIEEASQIVQGTYIKKLIFADGTKEIPVCVASTAAAFDKRLTEVVIPEGVEKINGSAFQGCSALTSITIPDSVTDLGWGVFYNCTSLSEVTFGSGLTSLYGTVFANCTALTTLELPQKLRILGENVFLNCPNLTQVTIHPVTQTINSSAFSNCPNVVIRCAKGSYAEEFAIENNLPYDAEEGLILKSIIINSNLSGELDEKVELEVVTKGTGSIKEGTYTLYYSDDPEVSDPNYDQGWQIVNVTPYESPIYEFTPDKEGRWYLKLELTNHAGFYSCIRSQVIGNKYDTEFYLSASAWQVATGEAVTFTHNYSGTDAVKTEYSVYEATEVGEYEYEIGDLLAASDVFSDSFTYTPTAPGFLLCTLVLTTRNGSVLSTGTFIEVTGEAAHAHVRGSTQVPAQAATPQAPGWKRFSYASCKECGVALDDNNQPVEGIHFDLLMANLREKNAVYYPAETVLVTRQVTGEDGAQQAEDVGGQTLSFLLADAGLQLSAQVLPSGGTKPGVTWSSSNNKIAEVSTTGLVTFKAPGTVKITARNTDRPYRNTTVTLTLSDRVAASKFTATLAPAEGYQEMYHPKTGLQAGALVQVQLWDENGDPVTHEDLEYRIVSGGQYAAWEGTSPGLLRAVAKGSVKLEVSLKDDLQKRKAALTVKVISPVPSSAVITPVGENTDADITADGFIQRDGFTEDNGVLAVRSGAQKTFQIKAAAWNLNGEPVASSAGEFTWKASSSIATVKEGKDGIATVTVKKNAAGECVITATSKQDKNIVATLLVRVERFEPELVSAKPAMNTYLSNAAIAVLKDKAGNRIAPDTIELLEYDKTSKSYIPSADLAVRYDDGCVTIDTKEKDIPLANGSRKLQILAATEKGESYTFTMTLTIKNSAPSITVKQTRKVNLLDLYPCGTLTVTAKLGKTEVPVTGAELTDTDYTLAGENGVYNITLAQNKEQAADTKGTLNVTLEGYRYVPPKALTVSTEKKAAALTTNTYLTDCAVYVDLAPGMEAVTNAEVTICAYNSKTKAYDLATDEFTAEIADGRVQIKPALDGKDCLKNGARKLQVQVSTEHGMETADVSLTVKNSAPSVTVKQTRKLNLLDPGSYGVITVSAKNAVVTGVRLSDMGYTAYPDAEDSACWMITYDEDSSTLDKDTKGYIHVQIEGYRYVPPKSFSLSTAQISLKAVLEKTTLTLYRSQPELEVQTRLDTNFENIGVEDCEFACANAEGKKLEVVCKNGTVTVRARDQENMPRNGSYSFTVVPTAADEAGTKLSKITLSVKVQSAPK